MKQRILVAVSILFAVACTTTKKAFVVETNGTEKNLVGYITKEQIETNPSYSWFKENYTIGKPNAAAMQALKAHEKEIKLLVFGGTWCGDTKALLPGFLKTVDSSGFAYKHLTLVGVDRKKHTLDNLHETYQIKNVPTVIVLDKDGKELGRVVEYGKYGVLDKEVGEIITKAFAGK
ncbi:MAG: thioredoxin [Bacteroidetes bacterium]|nr:MAG: thioredoxin [Bacteroidota bacterium]TAE66936.1 MAG: thioredoxin [Bacteroidota bacterium]TAF90501.1 MAG: thioredoxin [Bacteroidota bacterium]